MASNISFNPITTSNGYGGFFVSSDGYVQGVAMDDPAVRNALAGGVLASTETSPMWGGIAISEYLGATPSDRPLGPDIKRAANNAGITGFSVFNQAHGMINSPQSQAPSAGAGMSVNFFRLGSGARIALAIDPTLVSLNGGLITQQVSWDFTNQKIIAYSGGIGALAVKILAINIGNSKTITYDGTNNLVNWVETGSCALVLI